MSFTTYLQKYLQAKVIFQVTVLHRQYLTSTAIFKKDFLSDPQEPNMCQVDWITVLKCSTGYCFPPL